MTTIVLADGHAWFAKDCAPSLGRGRLVGGRRAADGLEAVELVTQLQLDVLIVDLMLPSWWLQQESRMRIECISKGVANLVQGILLHHGIRSSQQGPFISSAPTIMIMPIGAIDSEKEAAIRRDIQRIAGATIHG